MCETDFWLAVLAWVRVWITDIAEIFCIGFLAYGLIFGP